MSIDGHQKHSKAVGNTGRNSFSTLLSTLDIFLQVAAFRRQRSAEKLTYAAAKQRSGMVLGSAVARQRSATYEIAHICHGRGLVKEASQVIDRP
jgi:hypothetical protein